MIHLVAFTFTLALRHELLGEVMHQHSRFRDQLDRQKEPYHD